MKRIKKLLMPLLEWALFGEFDAALAYLNGKKQ
jgi:hypothetical protein